MVSDEIIKGNIYKVYDTEDNGKILYSAARFEGEDSKGNKFALINRPRETYVWVEPVEMEKLVFCKSSYKSK